MTKYVFCINLGTLLGYFCYINIAVSKSLTKIIFVIFILSIIVFYFKKFFDFSFLLFLKLLLIFSFSFCVATSYISSLNKNEPNTTTFKGQLEVQEVSFSDLKKKYILYDKNTDLKYVWNPYVSTSYVPGDKLIVSGELISGTVIAPNRKKDTWESFNYTNYLRSIDVVYQINIKNVEKLESFQFSLTRLGFKLREKIDIVYKTYLPDNYAGVLLGMIFGDNRSVTQETNDMFRDAGVSHVLVFSGYNFVILISIFGIFWKKLSKKWQIVNSIFVAVLILLLMPTSSPTARAGLFVIYSSLASYFNKQYNPKLLLWVFSLVYIVYSPYGALYSSSLHLTILATAAIIYFGEIINSLDISDFKKYTLTILSVFIVITPYIAYVFGNVSIFSIVTNFLILPVVSLIMVLGLILISLAAVSDYLAFIVGDLLGLLFSVVFYIVKVFSEYSISVRSVEISLSFIILLYIIIVFCYFLLDLNLKTKKLIKYIEPNIK